MNHDQSIVSKLISACQDEPNRGLFTFLDEQGQATETLTAQQLCNDAAALGYYLLHECGIKPGEVVLLVYLPSLDFVKAFTACLLSGIIPAPLAAPTTLTARDVLTALSATAQSSQSVAVLSHDDFLKTVSYDPHTHRIGEAGYPNLAWYSTNINSDNRLPLEYRPQLDDLAFLQYTSGSTSLPKGVMITHGNLAHQLQGSSEIAGLSPADQNVLWLPHYHDFCLICGICAALYGNGHLYLMSPLTYLFNPGVWFDVMTRVRATNTASPDFGYRYAVANTKPEQRRKWNLSSLKTVMNAAEPVHLSTIQNFIEAFSPARFNPNAFCPSYGLAEHTGGVTIYGSTYLNLDRLSLEQRMVMPVEDGVANAISVIGCGRPFDQNVDIRIVDPDTFQECASDQVGEIWLDSPSKGLGYYGLNELSYETFYASLQGDSSGRQYLRTGDLGFMFEQELFVTGRIKDLIIVRGHNFYPHDIEDKVLCAHADIRDRGVVAFQYPVSDQQEQQIGLIVEAQRNQMPQESLQAMVQEIRQTVKTEFRLSCAVVAIVAPGTILRTTSGKLKRQATASDYLNGHLSQKILLKHIQ